MGGKSMDALEVMRKSDVFQYLSDDELKELEKMCRHEVFEPGTTIFRQDKEAIEMYVIEEGSVSILFELSPADLRQIQAASNFECFGWAATMPPYRRQRTVKALEKTKVLTFSGEEIHNLINTNPRLLANIMVGVAHVIYKRLQTAFTQLMGVTYQF